MNITHAMKVYQGKGGLFYWRLRQVRNRKIVMDGSQGYASEYNVHRAIKKLPFDWKRIVFI